MKHLVAFIGFGEAAFAIASGLNEEGLTGMIAYDVMQDKEPYASKIRANAAAANVEIAPSLEAAVEEADFVLSLNSAKVCIDVAKQIVPMLKAGQVLCDHNSAAPTSMEAIGNLEFPEGVLFCDVAMMGSVPAGRHQVKMYLSGNGAQKYYDAMKPYHVKMTVLDAPAGGASAIKMFKSVMSKGTPQLILESLMPAVKFGVYNEVLAGLGKEESDLQLLIHRTMIHAARRAGEMHDVSETIEAMGLDASMSRACEKRLNAIGRKDYKFEVPEDTPLPEMLDILIRDWE